MRIPVRTILPLLALSAACTRAPAPAPAAPPEPGPDAGTVAVEIEPYGVDVSADGIVRCKAPCSIRLAPGLHRISVRKGGFMPWQEDVLVRPGAEVKVSASLVGSH
ncbi:MAG: PEGA domain-containing protein [Anaeromyxobacteraceae bacterium]